MFRYTHVSYEFSDTGTKAIIYARSVGPRDSRTVADTVTLVSPLIVSCVHRTLDMFFEWLITENESPGHAPYMTFEKKVRVLEANDPRTLDLPFPLDTARHYVGLMHKLYISLLEHRHALAHRVWGAVVGSDIQFDHTTPAGKRITRTITQDRLMDTACLVGRLMASVLDQTPVNILDSMILEWLADRARPLIHEDPSGLLAPLCEVVQRNITSDRRPIEVDLTPIREWLARVHPSRQVIFELIVCANEGAGPVQFRIPADEVPTTDKLILDGGWNRFRTG
ncbi:MAG: hypothetical protein Q8P50_15395 [Bacillota bacterium]|nr:hypothetical protein [Bacillota bacterium]